MALFSVNQRAVCIVKDIINNEEELNVKVIKLKNGATVIDMGVEVGGGWIAAKRFCEATIGGLGEIKWSTFHFPGKDLTLPAVEAYIDNPIEATLSSQFSGWRVTEMPPNEQGIAPIGSGPARAAAYKDRVATSFPYKDTTHEAVLAIQGTQLPDEEVAEKVAADCKISPQNLYILVAPTGSLVGCVQVCARNVEPSMWRMHNKGFDVSKIISGYGISPIPPVTRDELRAMDRVNTCLLYGTSVYYVVDCEDEEIEAVIDSFPLSASYLYGTPFIEIFEKGNRDFYEIDKDVHTVAKFTMNNQRTGRTFSAGVIRHDMLEQSLFT